MNRITDILLLDLRHQIASLCQSGGLIGPSVYDTAQVLRLAPPPEGVWPAFYWLIDQQQPDGGWGDPSVPRARDVPTLAAILALSAYDRRKQSYEHVRAGLRFLRHQSEYWAGNLPEDLPVGIELLLPRLLEEAGQFELDVPFEQYGALVALGQRRRRMLERMTHRAGTTPAHSWEAWGQHPDPALLDGSGGVGHSPSATAAWLAAAAGRPELADAHAAAQHYLRQAAAATGSGIPGVVPTVWPISRFEQANALYALLLAGLLDHPALADVVATQVRDLAGALRPDGIGMSDYFITDGDDTAVALAVLHQAGFPVKLDVLQRFAHADHYVAYHGELQPSISVTTHAAHALALLGDDAQQSPVQAFIRERQLVDGRWLGDKWNGSWLYTTGHIVTMLQSCAGDQRLARTTQTLLSYQWANGGWGMRGATVEETAYAILALRSLVDSQCNTPIQQALARAGQFMLEHYQPFSTSRVTCWLGKELYRPDRLVRVIELAAALTPLLQPDRAAVAALRSS